MATIDFGVGFGGTGGARRLQERTYRICVMGDFGGEATGRLVEVDRDNLDQVMTAMQVSAGGLPFRALDDFHPDRLLDRITVGAEPPSAPLPASPSPPPTPIAAEGLLDSILSNHAARRPAKSEAETMVERLVAEAAATAPRVAPEAAKPGAAAAAALRQALHDPRVKSVEAAWRSLALLVNRLDTGAGLKVHMLDLPPAQLVEMLSTGRLGKLLAEGPIDSWSTWVALWRFPAEAGAAALLARFTKLAATADVTLLAGGDTALAGCRAISETPDPDDWNTAELTDEAATAWAALMRLPEAAHLGLIVPRLLLRLPYGKDSDPIERFGFEEFPDPPAHERLLWGSGAVAAALMLATAKNDPELDRVPLYVRKDPLGNEAVPPTEAALSLRAAGALSEVGFIPLVWVQHTDKIRVGGWRGLAGARLAGQGAVGT
jgi:type VI secretion system protein ImpC